MLRRQSVVLVVWQLVQQRPARREEDCGQEAGLSRAGGWGPAARLSGAGAPGREGWTLGSGLGAAWGWVRRPLGAKGLRPARDSSEPRPGALLALGQVTSPFWASASLSVKWG